MKRPIIILMAVLLCAGAALAPAEAAWGRRGVPRNIILVGWDGAQRNHVKECLSRGELPALKQLSSEGALVAIDVLRTTDTKSGWTQILTGHEPEVTGVYSNGRYQPIPKGLTVFERLEAFFGAENIATLAVIGKKGHVDADGPQRIEIPKNPKLDALIQQYGNKIKDTRVENLLKRYGGGKVIEENGVRYLQVPGKPYFYTKEGMDLFQNGLGVNDNVGRAALETLNQYKDSRFFFFVHFADVDHQGHKFGENSTEYNDALISCDRWLGELVRKLKELKLYDDTLIYVTADHGFDENQTGHNDAPYVFLGTNDPMVVRRGTRADITPTILERFGLNLKNLQPALDGAPLTKTQKEANW